MPQEKTTKEKLLEEFNEFTKTLEADFITEGYSAYGDLEDFISQTIDKTREETIREVEEMLPIREEFANGESQAMACGRLLTNIKQSLKSLINK